MPRAAMPTLSCSPPTAGRAPELPASAASVRPRDRLLLGALVLAIGGVWIGVPLRTLVGGAPPPWPGLGVAGSCALLAVGACHLLWALDLLLRRRTLTVGASTLQVAGAQPDRRPPLARAARQLPRRAPPARARL